jgi:hypothetical protein
VTTTFIGPASPWENGYCESFNSKLVDELLAGEQPASALPYAALRPAQTLADGGRTLT